MTLFCCFVQGRETSLKTSIILPIGWCSGYYLWLYSSSHHYCIISFHKIRLCNLGYVLIQILLKASSRLPEVGTSATTRTVNKVVIYSTKTLHDHYYLIFHCENPIVIVRERSWTFRNDLVTIFIAFGQFWKRWFR